MIEKKLPIGSICILQNGMKVMITGYLSPKYEKGFKIYDYAACPYPEGTLSSVSAISFDQVEIKELLFKGYADDSYLSLKENLMSTEMHVSTVEREVSAHEDTPTSLYVFDEMGRVIEDHSQSEKKKEEPMYQFDENGIVIEDASAIMPPTVVETEGKYVFDENGRVTEDLSAPKKSPYIFDASGRVVEDGTAPFKKVEIQNPFAVESSLETPKENHEKWPIFKDIQFDEKGVVVSATEYTGEAVPVPKEESKYKFDENGIVIAE